MLPYAERRDLLEELDLENQRVRLVATFEDGEALFAAVCERGLEGVVAKQEQDLYRPGDRAWVKTKNRATARFAEESEGIGRRRRIVDQLARMVFARCSPESVSQRRGAVAGLAVVASPMVEPRGDERLPQTSPSRLGLASKPDTAASRYAEARALCSQGRRVAGHGSRSSDLSRPSARARTLSRRTPLRIRPHAGGIPHPVCLVKRPQADSRYGRRTDVWSVSGPR